MTITNIERKKALDSFYLSADTYKTFSIDLQEDLEIFCTAASYSNLYNLKLPEKFKTADRPTVIKILQSRGTLLSQFPKEYGSDEEFVMTALSQSGEALEFIDKKYKDDINFISQLFVNNNYTVHSHSFRHVSKKLKDNKDLVLQILSVHKYAGILEYLSDEFKNDMTIVMTALSADPHVLPYVSNKLKADPKFIKIIKPNYKKSLLRYVGEQWGHDRDFVLENVSVKEGGYQIIFASEELKNDREVVLAAISNDDLAFSEIRSKFKKDKSFLIDAVHINPLIFNKIDPQLKLDKDIALSAVTKAGWILKNMDESLRNNKKIALAAIKNDPKAIWSAGDVFKNDLDLNLKCIKRNGLIFQYAAETIRDNKEAAMLAIKSYPTMYQHMSETLKADPEIIDYVMAHNANMFKFTPLEYRKVDKNIRAALQINPSNLNYASIEYKNDKQLVLDLIEIKPEVIKYASKEIKNLIGTANPIKVLKSALLYERLNNTVEAKTEIVKNKIKI